MYVYIDGFNLFHGSLKGTAYKWLDLNTLSQNLFPNNDIHKIKYFTAPMQVRAYDLDINKPVRQQIYLRALRTLPNVEIYNGFFLSKPVKMLKTDGSGIVEVWKTEEKGTDVNIGAHLLNDGHRKEFEIAVVISNDSDLVSPIRMVVSELGIPVVVVTPYPRNSVQLKKCASSVRKIREGVLRVSQFPASMTDSTGQFTIPPEWV
jgi:uncharacterized LabA/DUF88 family protein